MLKEIAKAYRTIVEGTLVIIVVTPGLAIAAAVGTLAAIGIGKVITTIWTALW